MTTYDCDLFVIGGGSGGVRAARISANHGARVAIAEEYRYGGTCVIRGCVPKKLFVYASRLSHEIEEARGFGWNVPTAEFDWNKLIANKDAEIDRLNKIYISLLDKAGVSIYSARARLRDAHTIEVGDEVVTAKNILVATGGAPYIPEFPGRDLAISSNEAFHLDTLPEHVSIYGGGFIAAEFAHIFRGMGCRTALVYRRDKLLRRFDEDIRDAVTEGLKSRGIELHLETTIKRLERAGDGLRLELANGAGIDTGAFLCATGRSPLTARMGLEEAGVELDDRGAVVVDNYSRTRVDNIWAVGDCTNRINLTPVAIREGQAFADTVFGDRPTPVDHEFIPSAVFCQPPAASVGATEAEARARGEVDIYRATFRPLKHTLSGSDETVMMKLVVDAASGRVLGAHMVGDGAAEIIQSVAVAIKMGATKDDFDRTTALHPTTAEEFVLMRTKAG